MEGDVVATRQMKKRLIHKDNINEELRLIEGSSTDYIAPSGKVYKNYGDDLYYPKKSKISEHNGYAYVGITMEDGKNKNRRVHRLIAIAYIENPNPEIYTVVGHKNNIKYDNRIENLYWTTVSENTQKAYDDGLAHNDKGAEDSQSIAVQCFDSSNDSYIGSFGSISEASRETGMAKQLIRYQCINKCKPRIHKMYFRYELTKEQNN